MMVDHDCLSASGVDLRGSDAECAPVKKRKPPAFLTGVYHMVGPPGLEPGTKGLCLLLQLSLPVSSL